MPVFDDQLHDFFSPINLWISPQLEVETSQTNTLSRLIFREAILNNILLELP